MKSKIYIIVGFLITSISCYGQSSYQLNAMINESVEKYIESRHLDEAVFLQDNFPLDFQFEKRVVDNYKITFFDSSNYRKSELKQGKNAFRLLPIALKDNMLSIAIASVFVSYKGSNITINSGDYVIYEYIYSCEKRLWELLTIKEKGI